LAITDNGYIYMTSQNDDKVKIHRSIDIKTLKAFSWLVANDKKEEEKYEETDFILHIKDTYDQHLISDDTTALIKITEAIKYLYWKFTNKNIPIYMIPNNYKDKAIVTQATLR